MSGESWLQVFQGGKETVAGTAVAATRKIYGTGNLTKERDVQAKTVATGTRDRVRDLKPRAVTAGGSIAMPMSADELLEFFDIGIKGGVTPTTALGASTWVYTPGTLNTASIEWFDGYNPWQANGVIVNQIRIQGSVAGDNTITFDLFARDAITSNDPAPFAAMTAALTDRTPDYIEGWETQLFVDNFGGTAGTTNVPGTLTAWDVTINNNLGRKYTADNTTATSKIITGEIAITANLTLEGNAQGLAEFAKRNNGTKRLVRLAFGNNVGVGTGAAKKSVLVDIPGGWTTTDLSPEDQGTKVFRFGYQYVTDTTNAFPIRLTAITARATVWT